MVGTNNVQAQPPRRAGLSRYQQVDTLHTVFKKPAVSESRPMFSEDTLAADVPGPRLRPSASDVDNSVSEKSNDTFIPQFSKTLRDEEDYSAVEKPQDMYVPRFQSYSDNGHDPVTRDIAKSKNIVNDDDPPMSSSDDDDDPLSHRGHIQPTIVAGQPKKKTALSAMNGDKITTSEDEAVSGTAIDGSGYEKKNTRASASRKRSLGGRSDDDIEDPQPQKKTKTRTHKSEELGTHFKTDMDTIMERQWGALKKLSGYGGKTPYQSKAKASAGKPYPLISNKKHIAAQKQQTRTTSTKTSTGVKPEKETEIHEGPSPKLRIPPLFNASSGDQVSPTKKPMEKAKIRRAKPPRKRSQEAGDMSYVHDLEDDETPERAASDTTMPGSPDSPLSSLDSTFDTSRAVLCPMCDEELDEPFKEELKARRTRMTLHQGQQFCQSHKRHSAKKEWENRGYPDIDWTVLDKRIKKQYDFLRSILNGGKSYYANVFSDKIKSGQNKTLMKSDANLTPGYYGMRGLRIMSEHLVNKFSSELRKRAVQDRLVSKRGHTAYVQSVLVPELAVRLIIEDKANNDQKVTEEEARNIMTDSVWVGELLNEEDADHVLYEDEEDDESQNDDLELRDEDEAHLRYERESKLKHEDQDKPKFEDQSVAKQEDEETKRSDYDTIHIEDNDKVKSEDQNGAQQNGEDIKSNGNGVSRIKDEEDGDKLSSSSSLSSLLDTDSELGDL
ncbi:RTC4-like domain-containing protein [Pseudoneurospora amorphoporcata]|uniref:Restriction of telomere capping protein 4 n=1 Tax=Pseudoneurospora amorphoporcata TaxID=241081 RepID=A0AAN6NTR9_9PEZI|nr:RTC4-like domain-containing protein [Pseudoneurospora amorphoporcata]